MQVNGYPKAEKSSGVQFYMLGAGRPHQGEEHTALRNALGQSRVLDWLLQSVDFLTPDVHFVGGYQVEAIAQRYPDFQYIVNDEWQCTGAAYSLMHSPLSEENECLVSYVDILFRESMVRSLFEVDADIVVAVDSHWRKRFSGRTAADLDRSEKLFLHQDQVTRLGTDLDTDLANAEFVGCVRFGVSALAAMAIDKEGLRQRLHKGNLSDLVEVLRMQGLSVKAVDVCGDWAELNAPQDLAHFVLGTKAQTLRRLRGMVTHSCIEDQVSFTTAEWQSSPQDVMLCIQKRFLQKKLVIRSSALSEDGFSNSNAGAYTSLLNVDGACRDTLSAAIMQVVSSYPDTHPENQVLVQPMLHNVQVSGVVFTRTLACGAPYYVVNYDDMTGSTESITNGSSQGHKTLILRRDASEHSHNIPEHLKLLLPALREVESLLGYDSLDIEFALTAPDNLHILQVRPIAVDHSEWAVPDSAFHALLSEGERRFESLQPASPFVVGTRTIFGVMPDWNPAEIIGTKPGRLAMSLYRFLIMDEVWATQRAEYGYRDVRPQPLLVAFAGHPYVDVRASFNSFVPAVLDDALASRLVEFYLDWLEQHPHLHDKVEFDVVPTCFSLDFSSWEKRLMEQGGFSLDEVQLLRNALRDITSQALQRNAKDLSLVSRMEQRFEQINATDLFPLEKAYLLLQDCRSLGALPFAHLARSAFVAVTLLSSAVSAEVITPAERDDFLNTIRTISHDLTRDAGFTAQGQMSWDDFVSKYGHLRPGTYDVTSLSYVADPERYLRPLVERACMPQAKTTEVSGKLWARARERFTAALADQGLACDPDALERFMREAIEGREYAKFAFTRNLSLALDELVKWGGSQGVSREALFHLAIEDILALCTGCVSVSDISGWLSSRAKEGAELHQRVAAVELPPLICSHSDFSVFTYPSSQANYVGSANVRAACVELSCSDENVDLSGKIVLIPQADPGYDWLFGRGIAGLITMYGGANSHMAIRAAEFGLPAAIGVGESRYQTLTRATVLELNAANRLIQVVQ